jgi:hypothetical protein
MSEHENARETEPSVGDRVNAMIEGVLNALTVLTGPLTEEEEKHLRSTFAWELSNTLIRRLENNCFIGKGRDG